MMGPASRPIDQASGRADERQKWQRRLLTTTTKLLSGRSVGRSTMAGASRLRVCVYTDSVARFVASSVSPHVRVRAVRLSAASELGERSLLTFAPSFYRRRRAAHRIHTHTNIRDGDGGERASERGRNSRARRIGERTVGADRHQAKRSTTAAILSRLALSS